MVDLERRVELLEEKVEALATKQDLKDLAESLDGVVVLIKASSGLYRFILATGALFAAFGGIAFGFKETISKVIP